MAVERGNPQDEELLQAANALKTLRQSVENGESIEQFKAKVRSNRASIEKAFAWSRTGAATPAVRKRLVAEVKANQKLSRKFEDFLRKQLLSIAPQVADIDHWRKLAAEDRNKYRRELDGALKGIKASLNRVCGIESHRQRGNAARDKLIHEIKTSTPQFSFGQVALEYRRRTGKQLNGKVAERSYKRHDARIEAELEQMLLTLYHPEAVFPNLS